MAFTFLHQDGMITNASADITYENIWTSKKSGHSYSNTIHIRISAEDLDVTLSSPASVQDAAFVHEIKLLNITKTALLYETEFVHNERCYNLW